MSLNCFLSPMAEADMEDVIIFIAQHNAKAAHDFVDSLYSTFDRLAEYPEMGHLRQDLTELDVRFWTFKWHYLIIYKPAVPIEIVRVLSGYRDIVNLL